MPVYLTCSVDGCERPKRALGFCTLHYGRVRKNGDPLTVKKPRGQIQPFIENVILRYEGDECLLWPFSKTSQGRATFCLNGKMQALGPYLCEIVHGPRPSEIHEAAHSCGNGHNSCVNPAHLRWATPKENAADKKLHGTYKCGEQAWNAKLTEDAIKNIPTLKQTNTMENIAKIYGVSTRTIRAALSGQNWRHLRSQEKTETGK